MKQTMSSALYAVLLFSLLILITPSTGSALNSRQTGGSSINADPISFEEELSQFESVEAQIDGDETCASNPGAEHWHVAYHLSCGDGTGGVVDRCYEMSEAEVDAKIEENRAIIEAGPCTLDDVVKTQQP